MKKLFATILLSLFMLAAPSIAYHPSLPIMEGNLVYHTFVCTDLATTKRMYQIWRTEESAKNVEGVRENCFLIQGGGFSLIRTIVGGPIRDWENDLMYIVEVVNPTNIAQQYWTVVWDMSRETRDAS